MKAGGDPGKALNYVNQVRACACRISELVSAEPADLSSLTLEDVYDERRRELAFESHRFFDLRRWGLLEEKLDGFAVRDGLYTIDFETGKHKYLPIPEKALLETNGVVTQTPGY